MANKMIGSIDGLGFINKQRATPTNNNSGDDLVTAPVNYASIADLRSALTTANGAYYTTARLDSLTVNDMVYAVRTLVDNGTASNGTI